MSSSLGGSRRIKSASHSFAPSALAPAFTVLLLFYYLLILHSPRSAWSTSYYILHGSCDADILQFMYTYYRYAMVFPVAFQSAKIISLQTVLFTSEFSASQKRCGGYFAPGIRCLHTASFPFRVATGPLNDLKLSYAEHETRAIGLFVGSSKWVLAPGIC